MNTIITCPNCAHEFEPTDAIRDEVQKELRAKMMDWQKTKEEEYKRKEADALTQLEQQIRRQLAGDYEVQMKLLQQTNADNEAKLKDARNKELEYLKKQQELKSREEQLEIEVQQKLLQEREQLKTVLQREVDEMNKLREHEHFLKIKELEKQLEDQKMLTEEMKRKQEQGSMQLQGEVQELALEELLRNAFPFDVVAEVGKGVRGADCIQTVRNNYGQECGKIIYESKRTKDFSNEWIEKLKADMRNLGADIAVIVTQAMPKDMDGFGEKDGVWICNFTEVRSVSSILRDVVIRVYNAAKSQENKGDKMTLLYNYLISSEFSEQWKAIREGFMSMRISIQKEREQMEKLWKAREKQLEKVLLNAAHIKGSIEGIAGDNVDLNLEGGDGYLLE
ncbi:hypothetical protein CAP35_05985 [Chitinophagaceae bacterium IBVUCB1]|nr:hypothetical protein CAP35_05985 [Chitinophagaceae bacterium IBVUCB1]